MVKRSGSMSDDQRAEVGRHTRVRGVPVIADLDDTSPMQTIEERTAIRRKRPPSDRLEHLEQKHDALATDHHALALLVAGMDGKLDTIVDFAAASDQERARRATADAVAAAKREAIELAAEQAELVAAEKRRLDAIEDDKRAEEKRERRRKHLIALIGALAGGAAIVIAALAQGCL